MIPLNAYRKCISTDDEIGEPPVYVCMYAVTPS